MASASSIVAVFALVFWSFQLLPQAVLNHIRRSTAGLSPLLLLSWSLGSAFTGVNNFVLHLSPLFLIQPNLFLFFSLTCYAQCHFYPTSTASPYTPRLALMYTAAATAAVVGVEVGLVEGLEARGEDDPSTGGLLAANVLSLLCFILGFVPQYIVVWRERAVQGVSRLFLTIDMTGALLSTVALALTDDFAVVEAVSYIGVFVLDGGLLLLSFILHTDPATSASPHPATAVQAVKEEVHATTVVEVE